MRPAVAPVVGGTSVTISGRVVVTPSTARCVFSSITGSGPVVVVPSVVANATNPATPALVCAVPAQNATGFANVSVSGDGGLTGLVSSVQYLDSGSVSVVQPTTVVSQTSVSLTVVGGPFSLDSQTMAALCIVDGNTTSGATTVASVVNATTAVCPVWSGSAGQHWLSVGYSLLFPQQSNSVSFWSIGMCCLGCSEVLLCEGLVVRGMLSDRDRTGD